MKLWFGSNGPNALPECLIVVFLKRSDLKKAESRGHDDQTFSRCTEPGFVVKCPNLSYLFESLCVLVKSSLNQ